MKEITRKKFIGGPSPKSVKRVCREVHELTHSRNVLLPVDVVVDRVNKLLKGWGAFCSVGYPSRVFRKVNHYVLKRIRLHAPLGIGVGDVVQSMGCSRRTADMLFRKFLGRSILNEIVKAKVECVKAMLADGKSVSFISDMSGFTSANELDRVFRRVTGTSPRAWREGRR